MTNLQCAALGGLSFALVLGSCSTQRPAPQPGPTRAPTLPPPRALAPAAYVATAASIDLYVVRAGELALDRATDPRLRAAAVRLRDEHRGLAGQLSFAGRRLNALPTARLLPREAERLAWLAARQPFDQTFVRQMMLTHEQSLALHAASAARGSSATLRPVAANAVRVEQAHIALLRTR